MNLEFGMEINKTKGLFCDLVVLGALKSSQFYSLNPSKDIMTWKFLQWCQWKSNIKVFTLLKKSLFIWIFNLWQQLTYYCVKYK